MARPLKQPGKPRVEIVSLRLTAEGKAKLDQAAATAGTSRAEYVEALLNETTAGAALPKQQTA